MIRTVDKYSYPIPKSGDPRLHRDLQWYATDDNRVLGVVVLDLVDLDFSWVVLTENDQGPGFTALHVGHSLPTIPEATRALHQTMERLQVAK